LQPHRLQKEPGAPLSADAIASAASELGLQLSESQSDALARYAALLMRWNTVHNLTAIESPAHVLTHHLLDSLAIVPEIQIISGERLVNVLDVGAGGGLPGIPLAIAAPNLRVTLIDKVQKKFAFLTQAKLELALDNVTCVHGRVETLHTESPFELIVARAFTSLFEFVGLTRHLLVKNGWWCAMKGTLPAAELAELKRLMPDVRVVRTVRLHVPHLNAERHLVLMQAAR
jgi:16S rRNA (guanine527-N7)-methyltransferase